MIKHFNRMLAAAAACVLLSTPGLAKTTVEIVVGVNPGALQDHSARHLQKQLEDLDPTTNYIVVFKPGASGLLAYNYVTQKTSNPTIMLVSIGAFTEITKHNDYDTVQKQITLLGPIWSSPGVLGVTPKSGIEDFKAFMSRGQNGKLSCGAAAQSVKLALDYYKQQAKFKDTEVVLFKGTSETVPLIMSGELDCVLDAYAGPIETLHKSGHLKIIASSDFNNSQLFPKLPLMRNHISDKNAHLFSWWLALGISENNPPGFKEKIVPLITQAVHRLQASNTNAAIEITPLEKSDKTIFDQQHESARRMNQALAK